MAGTQDMLEQPTPTESEKTPWGTPLFPNRYVWFVLLSTLDVLLTFVILNAGGREANPLANAILSRFGISGMAIFKFILVVLVILLIEIVGRMNYNAARRLTLYAIALTMTPVIISFILLAKSL